MDAYHPVRGPDDAFPLVLLLGESGGKTEVSYLYRPVEVNQDIVRLYVSVQTVLAM